MTIEEPPGKPTTTATVRNEVTATPPPRTVVITPPQIVVPGQAAGTHSCRVLQDRGMDFAAVQQYWFLLGAPHDMDDDRDGIPCETVYGEWN